MSDEPETLNQLARRLKLPATWIKREAAEGRLPCLRVGQRFLFSPAAINQALIERAEQPHAKQEGGRHA